MLIGGICLIFHRSVFSAHLLIRYETSLFNAYPALYYGWTISFTNEFLYSLQTLLTFCLAIFEKLRVIFFGIMKLSHLFCYTAYVNITEMFNKDEKH